MEYIKDKEKTINELNELICSFGTPQELGKSIDNVIFDWLTFFMSSGECAGIWHAEQISNMKAIRDFLQGIELITK